MVGAAAAGHEVGTPGALEVILSENDSRVFRAKS